MSSIITLENKNILTKSIAIVWFRQDLRLDDNPALFEAYSKYDEIIPIYILNKNSVLGEAQAWWLHYSLLALKKDLNSKLKLNLILKKGNPLNIILELIEKFKVNAVHWNRCYEPSTIEQDKKIKLLIKERGINAISFKANLFNEPWTILNKNSEFYKVFTPYWNTCKQNLKETSLQHIVLSKSAADNKSKEDPALKREIYVKLHDNLSAESTKQFTPTLELDKKSNITQQTLDITAISDNIDDWNLLPTKPNWASEFANIWTPGEQGAQLCLEKFISKNLHGYNINRDIPEKSATSYLSPHLHFGEISPYKILRALEYAKLEPSCDLASAERFLAELGWREFSYYLLFHFPELPSQNFKHEFNNFPWHNDEALLTCWQKGITGYPIVDAGMRELWSTGYMHNRVRMIVASFLTKGLFIDWRKGADWFLNTLVDADLANNSASWQWVAGCGADAAPYFRIFNPILQSRKFDASGVYIRRWIPELKNLNNKTIHAPWESADASTIYKKTNYSKPIINHEEARNKALTYYKNLKK